MAKGIVRRPSDLALKILRKKAKINNNKVGKQLMILKKKLNIALKTINELRRHRR